MFSKLQSRLKGFIRSQRSYRTMLPPEELAAMSEEQRVLMRSRYNRHLTFFSSLLLLLGVLLGGTYFLQHQGVGMFEPNSSQVYQDEEELLTKRLNKIYGEGNWTFGIYQTNVDAYRVHVTFSNGAKGERFYRVSGNNIYEVTIE